MLSINTLYKTLAVFIVSGVGFMLLNATKKAPADPIQIKVVSLLSPTLSPNPSPTIVPLPNTPKPTLIPTPQPTPLPQTDYESFFDTYSSQYGVSKGLLKKIALCESHTNPTAVSGDYTGMFQFSTATWTATRQEMGRDINPELRLNAQEAIETAAFKISRGGQSAWYNCL